jgi:glycine cleavage system H protein
MGMKELNELNFPENLKYAEDHEWALMQGGEITIGICDYAQDQLGDVVFVELPQVGDTFSKGDEFGTVESVKAVSELFIPLSGEVTAVNADLEDTPELVNSEPYTGGWMIKIKPSDASEMDGLMTRDAYLGMLKG